jgi:hypothetical protein
MLVNMNRASPYRECYRRERERECVCVCEGEIERERDERRMQKEIA